MRFRNPVPHRGWSGLLDATEHRNVCSARVIMRHQQGLMNMTVPRGFQAFAWVPNVEPANSLEYRFLVDIPVNLMNCGDIMSVPFIVG